MSQYQHILFATDFSSSSSQVAEKTREIANECQAKVSLIHVVEYYQHEFNVDVYLPDLNIEQELIDQAKRNLAEAASTLEQSETAQFVEVGTPKLEIVRVADEQQCDLIILGSHGRHGLALLMGSTANGVLHHANCDVLAVRIKE